MKRSEMLEIMKAKATSFNGQRINDEFYDRFLDAILQEIEEAGMLPPRRNDSKDFLDRYPRGYEWDEVE